MCVAGVLGLSACSQVGPLKLSLAPSQSFSGANRTMESAADLASPPDTGNIEYKVFGELKTPRISGFAFSIGSKPDSKEWLRSLAAALNVQGDVVKESKNTFTIGFNKDTGAGVWLWADDAGSWWSYFPGNSSGASAPSASACVSGEECEIPVQPQPKNLLSADEAEARATRFLIQVGFSLNGFRLTATKNDYSTDVTGNMVVSGIPTNLNFSFSYGDNGELMAASGPLVTIRVANGYYLVSPEDGVKRLSDPRYSAVGSSAYSAMDRAVAAPTSSSNSSRVIPITRVEYTLMQSVLANTTTILLPAYTYYNEDGVVGTVIAMKDEYLLFGQMPVNTDEPSPLNTASRVTGSPGGSPATPPTMTPPTPESVQLLVGLTEYGANKVAKDNGWALRIAMKDGVAFQLTADYSESRVNLTVTKGIVTAVSIG
jgi:hypothetical protein